MGADGKLFFTRELQIWIVCQLKRWNQNMHKRYALTNKCFREGENSAGCLGEPPPHPHPHTHTLTHLFEPNLEKIVVVFYNIKNYPLMFFQNPFRVPLLRMSESAFGSPFLDQTSEKKMWGFQAVRSYTCTCSIWPTNIQGSTRQLQWRANDCEILVLSDLYSCSCMYSWAKT
jgi:hypothetical protein